ncbi:hypothetical protein A3Q56_05703 [Intoshia linei]|uniref:ADP-ribosylation factor-related protein 1 n=1 Tax=Intoshia linei TaxID=1819745 RepID=A0A177AX41_9BILA|nr:hypothetical protein A3Q56_05703 [Intoshia linei]
MTSRLSGLFNKNKNSQKIVVYGFENSGKTSFISNFIKNGKEVKSESSSIGTMNIDLKYGNHHLNIWDINGSLQNCNIWHHYLVNASAIIFILDAYDPLTWTESIKFLERLLKKKESKHIPLLIIGSKQDKLGEKSINVSGNVNAQLIPLMDTNRWIQFFLVSAVTGYGFKESVKVLLKSIKSEKRKSDFV